jgi:hypothetical protein
MDECGGNLALLNPELARPQPKRVNSDTNRAKERKTKKKLTKTIPNQSANSGDDDPPLPDRPIVRPKLSRVGFTLDSDSDVENRNPVLGESTLKRARVIESDDE